jgi:hypothetical protein
MGQLDPLLVRLLAESRLRSGSPARNLIPPTARSLPAPCLDRMRGDFSVMDLGGWAAVAARRLSAVPMLTSVYLDI